MPNLNDYISFNSDFRDSVNLYLDLNKADKINSYIPTKSSATVLKNYLESVLNNKMQSTILIGPYGKGKSHLLLLALAIMTLDRGDKNNVKIIKNLANRIGKVDTEAKDLVLRVWQKGRFLPVLIMSTQGDLNQAFMVGLNDALKREELTDIAPDTYYSYAIETIKLWKKNYKDTYKSFVDRLSEMNLAENNIVAGLKMCDKASLGIFKKIYPDLTSGGVFNPLVNSEVLPMYSTINDKLVDEYGYSGMFVIFDEFSKYIESQDKKNAGSNMKLLQDVCELANASKHSQLFFTMVAHKSIKEYGKYLSPDIINSFTGIEGRIKEVYFITSSKNNYELVQNAIHKEEGYERIPAIAKRLKNEVVDEYYQVGSFSTEFTRDDFERIVVRGCYPLSPISAYLLLNVSEKVAQNERTLFTFISKDEANSVTRYVNTIANKNGSNWVIGVPLIYDYFKSLFKKDVVNTFIHNVWLQAEYAISQTQDDDQIAVIKTMAILAIVNKPDEMPADRNTIILASEVKDPAKAIEGLIEADLIYKKASNNSYTFKTRASSELKTEIKKRKDLKAGRTNFNQILGMVSDVHYILPKRYNNDFKMTRYFRYEYMSVDEFLNLEDLNVVVEGESPTDGKFIVLYSENDIDESRTIKKKITNSAVEKLAVIYAAKQFNIGDAIVEYDVIQDIKNDAIFFKNEENRILEKELPLVEEEIEGIISDFLDDTYGPNSSKYVFYLDEGKAVTANKKSLSDVADIICNRLYPAAIVVNNELINKENITTAPIKKVRKTLIEQFLSKDNMDLYLSGTSAEATIYRALFVGTGLQTNTPDINAEKAIKVIDRFIDSTSKGKKSLAKLVDKLTNTPIGMRKGIIPIYLAYSISKRNEDVVVYFNSKEVQVDSDIILNMCEAPEDYSLFISPEDASKEKFLRNVAELFDVKESTNKTESRIHNLVIGMQRWYRALPQIAKNLKKNSDYWEDKVVGDAYPAFKDAMQSVETNPYEVLFTVLPEAFSCKESFVDLIARLNVMKKKLSEYYRWMIKKTVDATLGVFDPKKKKDLTHTLLEWYENQSDLAKHGLQSKQITNLMACIAENKSYDDGDVVKKVVRAVTDMYMDSWNDNSYEQYISAITETKEAVEALKNGDIKKTGQHLLTFTGKNGKEERCFYTHVDENTGAIFRNIISDTLEDFTDLSVNDKVAILLEMIAKELGK